MGRAAATTGRASTAVEDRELHTAGGRDPRQLLLGAVDLPLRRQVAAVLARVGVADHHLELRPRAAIEDLLDERAGGPQVADRLEQRHTLQHRARLRGQRLRVEDVVGRPGHGDDQPVDGVHAVPGLHPGARCERAAEPLVGRAHGRRVNAQVELGEVEPERPGPRAQVGEPAVGDPPAPMGAEQGVEGIQVGEERRSVGVGVVAEPLEDLDERGAERLVVAAPLGYVADHGGRHPPRRSERGQLGAVQLTGEPARTLQRILDRLRPDVRIAVEVAADPAAEPERLSRSLQPLGEGALEVGNGVPEALFEEPEPLPDLVDDPGALGAHLVGLPEQRDLLGEARFDSTPLGSRNPVVVEPGQERRDAAMRFEDGAACRLGRMRREHELDSQPAARSRERGRVDTAALELRERVRERFALNATLGLVLAPAADPMVLLGDVGELEEERERALHGGLTLQPERGNCIAERGP